MTPLGHDPGLYPDRTFMTSYRGGGTLVVAKTRRHAELYVRKLWVLPDEDKVSVWEIHPMDLHEYTQGGVEMVYAD